MQDSYWQGHLVRLRAVEPGDWEVHFRWDQDTSMSRQLDFVWVPGSKEAAKRWAEGMASKEHQGDAFHFQIENLEGELVGSIATHDCEPRNGTFSYGVAVRGEHQGKGYASEAILMVLRYYFQELRYQKCTVRVHASNEASANLHKKLGFLHEGRLRRTVYTGGEYEDELVFGITREEFAQLYLSGSFFQER